MTISEKIRAALKAQMAEGIYPPGTVLPSSRALASELGVARSTVTVAFEQLAAEGYVEMSQGSRPRVPNAPQPLKTSFPKRPTRTKVHLSEFARRLLAFPPAASHGGLSVNFRPGNLAGEDFPDVSWRRTVNAVLSRPSKTLSYDDPHGSLGLRKTLCGYLWRSRGVRCNEEQIIIVNGSQQGIDLCARVLLNTGDGVVIEDPGYLLARHAFEALGARPVPIPVDQDGMRTELLKMVSAKLAYVTPSHQFPLGGILPVRRRRQLLEWGHASQAFVIEDDYDGEYRYDTKPIETLHSLDPEGRVIYMGTMSKTLSPEIRLGYLVVPSELSISFALAKRLTDRHSALLQQRATQVFIESGALERHIRRIRRFNEKRRSALLTQLNALFGDRVSIAGTAAGLHVVLWFNTILRGREEELIATAAKRGLGLYGISPLYSSDKVRRRERRAGVVLGYAALSEAQIEKGMKILSSLLERTLSKTT